jgi:type II secretory pathway pseudopilin PulG
MSKLNQKGFSLVEGLLVIIALALVAFVGFYVWNAQKDTNKTLDTASKATQKASSDTKQVDAPSSAKLKTFLLKTCSTENKAAIDAMFANKARQTAETDNYAIEGNYAISNVQCDLASGMQLTTQFLKYSSGWNLVVDGPTTVSCTFLTNTGFPEKLRTPYCSNGTGGEGDFNT